VTEESRREVAERLRRRYPRPRLPRPVLIALVALLIAVAGWWLVTTAWQRARPPFSAEVSAFQIETDTKIKVTLTVDRPDPSLPVTCRVVAQANDAGIVGEQAVTVPASSASRLDLSVTLITLRRAVTAEVRGCSVP
jgi:Domain of unknown function (DUF4307)